jgi:hypothetical protein
MVVLMHRPCAEMGCMRPRMLCELSRLVDASGCEISKRSGVDVTRIVPNRDARSKYMRFRNKCGTEVYASFLHIYGWRECLRWLC